MSYHILLVDDDPYFRSEFQELMGDVDVISASNGKEALQILKKPHNIDLIILDQMMPGMKGTETLKHIRQISPDVFTILLTGEGSKEVAIEGFRNEATDFIEKPLNKKKINKIRSLILSAPGGEHQHHQKGLQGKIERAKHYAERNYNKKIKLEDVASEVALSPKYFSRIFKEQTGASFTEYRLKVKINKSKELLDQGQTVEEIAFTLGYQNPESFVKMFHKIANCAPTDYRKRSLKITRQVQSKVDKLGSKPAVVKKVKNLLEDKQRLSKEKQIITQTAHQKDKTIKRLKQKVNKEKHLSELGRMASAVAHELKHSLGVIQTAVWNIKKKSSSGKYDSNIKSIEKMIEQSELVLKNLLDYSHIKTPVFKKVELKSFLKDAVDLSQKMFEPNGPTITFDFKNDTDQHGYCDPIQIRQVIMNILTNAKESLDFKRRGKLQVYAYTKKNVLYIEIADNGKGIAKNDLEHIFDPFFTRKAKGTGLGLSICQEIINSHNGKIEVKSTPKQGTTFFIHIPLHSNKN